MKPLRRGWSRVRGLAGRGGEQDLADELESHIAMQTEDNLRAGMEPESARRAAVLKFGGLEAIKESYRDQRGLPLMERTWGDIRQALRGMRHNPGFTLVVVLTLALGIGANTTIFSMVNQMLLNPAGVSEPQRVLVVREKAEQLNLKSIKLSAPNFADVRESREVFDRAAAMQEIDISYTGSADLQRLRGAAVSAGWFAAFGAKPQLGRVFRPEEDQPNANHVAILSHAAWKRLFGGDPNMVGRSIELNLEPCKIVGVMDPDFRWPREVDVWLPIALPQGAFAERNRFTENLFVVARTKAGVSLTQANAWLKMLAERVRSARTPQAAFARNAGWGLFGVPIVEFTASDTRTALLVLLGAVGLVLLIACSNIAGLMLARTSARSHEITVRTALGASRWQLLRQMLTESLALASVGGIAGLGLAYGGVRMVLFLAPESAVAGLEPSLDRNVLLFTAAASIASGILFGIAPAWQMSRTSLHGTLRTSGRSSTNSPHRQWMRSALVVAETALALVLLVAAGLLLRSFSRLQEVRPGFNPQGVVTAAFSLPQQRYPDGQKQAVFYRAVLDRLANTSGVIAAAIARPIPFGGGHDAASFEIEGRVPQPGEPGPHGDARLITPDYFKALAIPLKRGRYLTGQDRFGAQQVTVIDETLARQYWPNEDPLGKRIGRGSPDGWFTIVGVVGNVTHSDLAAEGAKGVYYFSLYQRQRRLADASILAKTSGDPANLAAAIREAVHAADPNQPVHTLKTMEALVSESLAPRRFLMRLLGFFAATALFLAALGLYGVISYSVAQRTREIGIRMALGAERRSVTKLVVGQGLRLAGMGIGLGIMGSALCSRLLESQLFEVSALDPPTIVVVAVTLLAAAMLASYLPGRRAARVDPVAALRNE